MEALKYVLFMFFLSTMISFSGIVGQAFPGDRAPGGPSNQVACSKNPEAVCVIVYFWVPDTNPAPNPGGPTDPNAPDPIHTAIFVPSTPGGNNAYGLVDLDEVTSNTDPVTKITTIVAVTNGNTFQVNTEQEVLDNLGN